MDLIAQRYIFFKKRKKKSCRFRKKPYFCTRIWDGSSVGLERMLDRHEVTSSILVRPTSFFFGTLAQLV